MGVNRMTGVSWHVERHYSIKKYRRHCSNCVYYRAEGSMCAYHNVHISYNPARVCRYFSNMYYDDFDELNIGSKSIKDTDNKGSKSKVNNSSSQTKNKKRHEKNLLIKISKSDFFNNFVDEEKREIKLIFDKLKITDVKKLQGLKRIIIVDSNHTFCLTILYKLGLCKGTKYTFFYLLNECKLIQNNFINKISSNYTNKILQDISYRQFELI